jgi:TolB-like protein
MAEGVDVTEGGGEEQAIAARTDKPDVFISYASQDAAIATAVVKALERSGVACWIAPRDVTPGTFYGDEIVHAIDAAKASVLILSQNAAASQHVLREVERAASKRHPVVSLRIDQAALPAGLEYFLNTSQWLDASGGDTARSIPRLIAAVRIAIQAPTVTPIAAPTPLASTPIASARLLKRSAIIVASLVGLGIAWFAADRLWVSSRRAEPTPLLTVTRPTSAPAPATAAIPEKSVAVLPFVDMSEKKDQEYFADGLSEELIDHLARSPDLLVIARTSSFQFKGKNEDVRSIASKLGVAHVLEGSVRKSGTTLRITAQLIRASDGTHLWSQTYDRGVADVFKVQDEIAATVTQELKVKLTPIAIVQTGEVTADAHDILLKGNFFWQREGKGDLEKALALYQEAAGVDPNYALAWAKIAKAYHILGWRGKIPVVEARSKAYMAAERAIHIDPNLALAHRALGGIYRDFDWDWVRARSEFEKVIELDPKNRDARSDLGYLNWMETGDIDEEISALREDLIRDPLEMSALWSLALSYYAVGRLEESARTYERLLELSPDYVTAQAYYAQTLLYMGRNVSALAAVNKETSELNRLSILPSIYWALGRHSESDEALGQLKKGYAKTAPYNIADVYAFRGEVASAFEWLDRAFQQRDPGIANVKFDPYMRTLRTDPRFTELLHKLKLPD